MTGKEAENGAAARLVAVILDAARPYDRLIIGGVAQYVNEHAAWSLYVEEDPLQKLPDLRHWHGQGIIANFDDRRVASAIRGLTIPIVAVGGGYGWYEPASGIPYIYTDNAAIGRLGAEHLLGCGFEALAFYGYPRTTTSGWSEERAAAFAAACAAVGRPPRMEPSPMSRLGASQISSTRLEAGPGSGPTGPGGAACVVSSITVTVVSPTGIRSPRRRHDGLSPRSWWPDVAARWPAARPG